MQIMQDLRVIDNPLLVVEHSCLEILLLGKVRSKMWLLDRGLRQNLELSHKESMSYYG